MKNTIHRKSTLIKARSKVDNGLFKADNEYCFYKEDNNWKYTDDATGRHYLIFVSHIRNMFDIVAQC